MDNKVTHQSVYDLCFENTEHMYLVTLVATLVPTGTQASMGVAHAPISYSMTTIQFYTYTTTIRGCRGDEKTDPHTHNTHTSIYFRDGENTCAHAWPPWASMER